MYWLIVPSTDPALHLVKETMVEVAAGFGTRIEYTKDPTLIRNQDDSPRYSGSQGKNRRYVGTGRVNNTVILFEAFAAREDPPFTPYRILDDNPDLPEGGKAIVVRAQVVW